MAAQGAAAVRLRVVSERTEPQTTSDFHYKPLMTRREAEILFEIDAAQTGESPSWESHFVESIVEFVVFNQRPTGRISEADAAWLVAMIGTDRSPSIPALMRALVLQAEDVPAGLIRLAMDCGAMRTPAPPLV